jgi:hypothetical protein
MYPQMFRELSGSLPMKGAMLGREWFELSVMQESKTNLL